MTVLLIDGDFVESNIHNGKIIRSRMKTQGWWASNTAHLIFKNVRVSKKNVIGEINKGWLIIMHNFNHERFGLALRSIGLSRTCLNDSVDYAKDRMTFGKKLIDHQVIRHKIMEMTRKIEAGHALMERYVYLINVIEYGDYKNNEAKSKNIKYLGSLSALAKVEATQTLEYCAREAMQIFGGRGYLRNGRGHRVERIYREGLYIFLQ